MMCTHPVAFFQKCFCTYTYNLNCKMVTFAVGEASSAKCAVKVECNSSRCKYV